MTVEESRTYLKNGTGYPVHTGPQVTGDKITGVTAGRIVAYWPREDDHKRRPIGADRFIPAMIVASWAGDGSECPCANLQLFLDPSNHHTALAEGLLGVSSCQYSHVPAQGCWTWIPKA